MSLTAPVPLTEHHVLTGFSCGCVPVVVLGSLVIDQTVQGTGLGRALVRDAGLRVIQAADAIGIRGMVVHALSDSAKALFDNMGFEATALDPFLLMISLPDLIDACGPLNA